MQRADVLASLGAIGELSLFNFGQLGERVELFALVEASADNVGDYTGARLGALSIASDLSLGLAGLLCSVLCEPLIRVAKLATLSPAASGGAVFGLRALQLIEPLALGDVQ